MGWLSLWLPRGGRFRVARRLSVRKELIASGHPSGIRGPGVAGATDRRVLYVDMLVKGFLRVVFGGLIDTVGYPVVPWW